MIQKIQKIAKFSLLIIGLAFIYSPDLRSQDEGALLSNDIIFNSGEFNGEYFGQIRWIDDGQAYTRLERSAEVRGGIDIIKYNTKTGDKSPLIQAKDLIPKGWSHALRIENYTWSPDHSKLMIYTNSRRVWRLNTRGDYWLLDLENMNLRQLGSGLPESSLMFAKFSPDGTKVGYVSKNNIYSEEVANGQITQLTFDGSEEIINGTFDWVYEEEFHCRDGFRWSPDSEHIAYWQLDASGIGVFNLINYTDSIYSKVIPIQYPKVGTRNSAARIGVVSISGRTTKWMNIPGDPRNNYLARMDWAASPDELIIYQFNRLQNQQNVILANSHSGAVKTILVETDEAWVNVHDDLKWMDEGEYFTWISEKDGWRHMYKISRDGSKEVLLTPGNYDVISVQKIDIKKNYVYFIASPDDASQRYLYRVKMDGKGKKERLTPIEMEGTNSYDISPNAKWAIHTLSNIETPPVIDLISLPKHKTERFMVKNERLAARFSQVAKKPVEFFQVEPEEGVFLDGYMIKPPDFDSAKKYPVLFHVYSEPAGQTVNDSWGGAGHLWHLMLAQKGYIIVSVDNRGTPAPKGRAWRKSIYTKIGVLNPSDQAAAAKIISGWDFVDEDRIAIWGWSGGGSATLNALFQYPDIYKVGMSVAPVPNQLLYDNVYQERYMGDPKNKDVYLKGSPITYAENLKGKLLLVHGTGDDNVHYQGSELLINELIKQNKQFTMFAYPNRSHGIYEGPNTSRHLRILLTNFLMDNLQAGGK